MHREVYPGESFTIPSILVGYDSGPTIGVVYADILPIKQSFIPILDSNSQNGHVISNNMQCTKLSFTLFTNHIPENSNVTMYISAVRMNTKAVHEYSLSYPGFCNNYTQCAIRLQTYRSCLSQHHSSSLSTRFCTSQPKL